MFVGPYLFGGVKLVDYKPESNPETSRNSTKFRHIHAIPGFPKYPKIQNNGLGGLRRR